MFKGIKKSIGRYMYLMISIPNLKQTVCLDMGPLINFFSFVNLIHVDVTSFTICWCALQ